MGPLVKLRLSLQIQCPCVKLGGLFSRNGAHWQTTSALRLAYHTAIVSACARGNGSLCRKLSQPTNRNVKIPMSDIFIIRSSSLTLLLCRKTGTTVHGLFFHLQPSSWAYGSRPANFHQGLSAQRKSRKPVSSCPTGDLQCLPWGRAVGFFASWQGTSSYRI